MGISDKLSRVLAPPTPQVINATREFKTLVTPSYVNLCHSVLASILLRKWLNVGVGYST